MRLIDADAFMDDRKENGIPWHLGESESFRRLIERPPAIRHERTADHVKAEVIGKVRMAWKFAQENADGDTNRLFGIFEAQLNELEQEELNA